MFSPLTYAKIVKYLFLSAIFIPLFIFIFFYYNDPHSYKFIGLEYEFTWADYELDAWYCW